MSVSRNSSHPRQRMREMGSGELAMGLEGRPSPSPAELEDRAPAASAHDSVPLRVLLVEASPEDAEFIRRELLKTGRALELTCADTLDDVAEALNQRAWDVVLCDYARLGFDGLDVLGLVRRKSPDLPFILVSGKIDQETAGDLLRQRHESVSKDHVSPLHDHVEELIASSKGRLVMSMGTRAAVEELIARNWALEGSIRELAHAVQKLADEQTRLEGLALRAEYRSRARSHGTCASSVISSSS